MNNMDNVYLDIKQATRRCIDSFFSSKKYKLVEENNLFYIQLNNEPISQKYDLITFYSALLKCDFDLLKLPDIVDSEKWLKENGVSIIKYCGFVPQKLKSNKYLFDYFKNEKNIDMAAQFDFEEEFDNSFSKEEINNAYDKFMNEFDYRNTLGRITNSGFVIRCIEKNRKDVLIVVYTEVTDDKLGDITIDFVNKILSNNCISKFSKSKKVFDKLIEMKEWNIIADEMSADLFTKDIINKYFDEIIQPMEFNDFVRKFRSSKSFFECEMDNSIESDDYSDSLIWMYDFSIIESEIDKYGEAVIKMFNTDKYYNSFSINFNDNHFSEKSDFVRNYTTSDVIYKKILELGNIEYLYTFLKKNSEKEISDNDISNHLNLFLNYVNKYGIDNANLTNKIMSNTDIINDCIENKYYSLLLLSPILPKEVYNKYYDEFKKAIIVLNNIETGYSILNYKNSTDFLELILENKDYDYLEYFGLSAYNSDSIIPYYDEIINYYKNRDISNCKIILSSNFFKYCFEKKDLDTLSKIGFNKDIEEIIKNNTEEIVNTFDAIIPESFYYSDSLFKYFYNKKDNTKLLKFSMHVIDNLGDEQEDIEILDYITSLFDDKIPENYIRCYRLFRYYIEKGEYDKVYDFSAFVIGASFFDFFSDNKKEYFKSKLPYIMPNLTRGLPDSFKMSNEALRYCIDNDYYEYLLQFNTDVYEYMYISIEDGSKFIKAIEEYNSGVINENICSSICIKGAAKYLGKNDIFIQFQFIENDIEKLKDSEELDLYSELLGISKEKIIEKLNKYLRKNDEVLNTILPFMLSDKYNVFKEKDIEKIIIYPDLQLSLYKMNEKELNLIAKIMPLMDNEEYDLTGLLSKIINNLSNYKNLIDSIDINNLNEKQFQSLLLIIQRKNNIFSIDSIDKLYNIDEEMKKYFDIIDDKINNKTISLEELKEAALIKIYGIDIEGAKFICERYCHDMEMLKNSKINKKIYSILNGINNIYISNDIDELKFLYDISYVAYTDFYTIAALEASIRGEYAKLYNESLYKLKDEHKLNEDNELYISNKEVYDMIQSSTYNGFHPDVYIMDGDFNLQIHALGAYRHWEVPENFKDDWLRPKIAYHGICTSYIANNQIATARATHPIYGFDSYENSALLCAGNYDLFSDTVISKYDSGYRLPYTMFPPKEMIDNTRHTHNEMVIERRNIKESSTYKRLPSYVIYIVDDINNKENFSKDNRLYNEILQASVDQNIPILIVDRLKYAKSEKKKCENLYNEFLNTKDYTLLSKFFLEYFNNIIGCNYFNSEPRKAYNDEFNVIKLIEYIQKILIDIEKFNEIDRVNTINCIINSIELENEKRNEEFISTKFLKEKLKDINMNFDIKETNIIDNDKVLLKDIANYYYSSNDDIQQLIFEDISNGLSRNEIMDKIKKNIYGGCASQEQEVNEFNNKL